MENFYLGFIFAGWKLAIIIVVSIIAIAIAPGIISTLIHKWHK